MRGGVVALGGGSAARGRAETGWPAASAAGAVRLRLLGGFRLLQGRREVEVRRSGERLLAFVALRPGSAREAVAWRLWADHAEEQALACLRSALWRLPRPAGQPLIATAGGQLRLAPHVALDLEESASLALGPPGGAPPPGALAGDLLPDWYDDWLVVERERHHQLRLHALEALAALLLAEGRTAEAIEVGLRAVGDEPLRESAHRCVVREHLAEGNPGEALRQARTYLGVLEEAGTPGGLSAEMDALLEPVSLVGAAR